MKLKNNIRENLKYEINDIFFEEENFPVIATERVILSKLNLSYLDEFYKLRADISTAEEMGVEAFEKIEDAEEMILNTQYSYEFKCGINWAICLKKDLTFIGTSGIWRINRDHFRGEIGYSLLPEFRKKGYMTEVLKSVINFAFKKLNLHTLEANTDPANFKSMKLLKKLGFVQEGFLKENYFLNGKFYDTALFSIVSENCADNR